VPEGSRCELAFEMMDQLGHGLGFDQGVTRWGEEFSGVSQRFAYPPEFLSTELTLNQAQHGSYFLDVFARAMNRLTLIAIRQTFAGMLDSIPRETPDPFGH